MERPTVPLKVGQYNTPLGPLFIEETSKGIVVSTNRCKWCFKLDGTFSKFEVISKAESADTGRVVYLCSHVDPKYKGIVIRIVLNGVITLSCPKCVMGYPISEEGVIRAMDTEVWEEVEKHLQVITLAPSVS